MGCRNTGREFGCRRRLPSGAPVDLGIMVLPRYARRQNGGMSAAVASQRHVILVTAGRSRQSFIRSARIFLKFRASSCRVRRILITRNAQCLAPVDIMSRTSRAA